MKEMKVRKRGRKCGRKQRFHTEYDADYVLGKMQDWAKKPVRVYYHSKCDGFHITSQPLIKENHATR
jgi:hypothetical protein